MGLWDWKDGAAPVAWLLLFGAAACSPRLATPPPRPALGASLQERRVVYDAYRLEERGDIWFGYKWSRKDGEYEFEGVEPLLESYPATRARVAEIKTRAAVILPMAAVGGALLGMAIGDSLSHEEHLFSRTTRTGLYATGGALSAASLTIAAVWDPVTGIGPLYNQNLAESLAVPAPHDERQGK